MFSNCSLAYLVTSVRGDAPCPGSGTGTCAVRTQQVQVVDLAGGRAVARGKVQLPTDPWSGHGWGWYGFWWYVYRLRDNAAPQFEQTVRTRGWGVHNVSRQDQTLFLSSGYWGIQAISLQ